MEFADIQTSLVRRMISSLPWFWFFPDTWNTFSKQIILRIKVFFGILPALCLNFLNFCEWKMRAQLAELPPFAVYLFFSKCNSNYQARRAIKTGCSVQYFSTVPTYIRSPTSTLSSFRCQSPLPSHCQPLVHCRFFPSKLSAHLLSSLILTSLINFLGPSFDARCKATLDSNQVC